MPDSAPPFSDPEGIDRFNAFWRARPWLGYTLLVGGACLLGRMLPLVGWMFDVAAFAWVGLLIFVHWETPWVRDVWRWVVERIVAVLKGARAYRSDAEKNAHEEQSHETMVTLGLMADASQGAFTTPEQQDYLNQSRVGAENMLAELEKKPRLTLKQLQDRDAIETYLYGAPLRRVGGVSRGAVAAPQGFLGGAVAAAAGGGLGVLGSWPVLALAASVTLSGWGWAWLERGGRERAEERAGDAERTVAAAVQEIGFWKEEAASNHQAAVDAADQIVQARNTVTAERARNRRAAEDERRRRNAIQDIIGGDDAPAVDWGLPDAGPYPGAGDAVGGQPAAGAAAGGDSG